MKNLGKSNNRSGNAQKVTEVTQLNEQNFAQNVRKKGLSFSQIKGVWVR